MSYMQIRGGTRGGKDQFEWDDVKTDKHRENYLGKTTPRFQSCVYTLFVPGIARSLGYGTCWSLAEG